MKSAKKRRATEIGTPVMVRLQANLLSMVDEWRRAQSDLPGRSEAIRRVIYEMLAPTWSGDVPLPRKPRK